MVNLVLQKFGVVKIFFGISSVTHLVMTMFVEQLVLRIAKLIRTNKLWWGKGYSQEEKLPHTGNKASLDRCG